jgi:hypothetical protein
MHPELLRALAKARHEDLLSGPQIRRASRRPDDRAPRFARSRRRVGLLLIWAGARLMREKRAALELAHE